MSIEAEARKLLLTRRQSLCGGPADAMLADPAAGWRDWETQPAQAGELTRRELDEIEAALRRIDDGSYGRCEACGGALGMQRLRAIPEARFCLSCSGHRSDLE